MKATDVTQIDGRRRERVAICDLLARSLTIQEKKLTSSIRAGIQPVATKQNIGKASDVLTDDRHLETV